MAALVMQLLLCIDVDNGESTESALAPLSIWVRKDVRYDMVPVTIVTSVRGIYVLLRTKRLIVLLDQIPEPCEGVRVVNCIAEVGIGRRIVS